MERRREREELYSDVVPGVQPASGGGDWKAANSATETSLKRARSPGDDDEDGARAVSGFDTCSLNSTSARILASVETETRTNKNVLARLAQSSEGGSII